MFVSVSSLSLAQPQSVESGDDLSEDPAAAIQVANFEFIQGDFTENQVKMQILDAFHLSDTTTNSGANLVLSDMAPNFTGDSQTDALRTLNLCEQALEFVAGDCFDPSYDTKGNKPGILADGGDFLCKYFKCGRENESDLREAAKRAFQTVHLIKPKASRRESSEMYLLALGFNRSKAHSSVWNQRACSMKPYFWKK